MNDGPLTHFDPQGASRMVDVSAKAESERLAVVEGWVQMAPETLALICDRKMAKGDVFEVARIAGIMAAKRVDMLIPLCHQLNLTSVKIDFTPRPQDTPAQVHITAQVKTVGKTGVEMEALTAATVAALTIYDMCKAVDRGMTLGPFRLMEKAGGRSGHYLRP